MDWLETSPLAGSHLIDSVRLGKPGRSWLPLLPLVRANRVWADAASYALRPSIWTSERPPNAPRSSLSSDPAQLIAKFPIAKVESTGAAYDPQLPAGPQPASPVNVVPLTRKLYGTPVLCPPEIVSSATCDTATCGPAKLVRSSAASPPIGTARRRHA